MIQVIKCEMLKLNEIIFKKSCILKNKYVFLHKLKLYNHANEIKFL
jgi:hypothetical protein